ncbi:helix-turn-helix domain-containing protein [Thioalkalivibrio sp. ALJ24]|uniref:helix-turn-helix domain-containing protein n=1 Tax=Thioalkalivibrio sp. ALJ24 TaxID=545276 RepID=UPI000477EADD|nr:AraC family transcriptional regulator [Thioalkalivibrio sp. ALJ24]
MLDFFERGQEAPFVKEARTPDEPPAPMIENAHPPGRLSTPPVPELMISQCRGTPFRFRCDIGAGAFSGWGLPRNFVVIAPRTPAYCEMRDPARLQFIGIPPGLARACLERDRNDPLDFGRVHSAPQSDPLIGQALTALWQEMGRDDAAAQVFVESMIAALVVRLARLDGQAGDMEHRKGGLAPHHSKRVIEYMQAHLAHRITLSDLAAQCDLSPWHFARAFRVTHGQAPHRFLTGLRIQHARELLEHTSLPVTAVAAATGYSAPQLTRHFRQAAGITPSEYRRQHSSRP